MRRCSIAIFKANIGTKSESIAFKYTGRNCYIKNGKNEVEIIWDDMFGFTDEEIAIATCDRYPFLDFVKIKGEKKLSKVKEVIVKGDNLK